MAKTKEIIEGARREFGRIKAFQDRYHNPGDLTLGELNSALKEYQEIALVAGGMIVVGIGSSLEFLPNVFFSQIILFTVVVPGFALLDKAHGQIKSLTGEAQKRDLSLKGRTFLTKRIKL